MAPRQFPHSLHALVVLIGSLFLALNAAAQTPNAPTNLRGCAISATSLAIVWDDNSNNETNFDIGYTLNGGALQSLPTIPANQNSALLPLPNGITTATFKVRAYNSTTSGTVANPSAYTNQITINLVGVASPSSKPGDIAAVNRPDGSVLLRWSDNAIDEAGYFIEYASASAGPYSVLGSVGANPTGISIPNLAPGTTYFFRVHGFQGTASSPTAYTAYSDPTSVATGTTLLAPTGLTVTASSPTETSATLSFTDNSALNNRYSIEYALQGTGNFVVLGNAGDGSPINATNLLAPGTAYDFRVNAYYDPDGTGAHVTNFSGYSNTASYTTPFSAPTGLTATTQSDTQVNLSWTNNSQAQGGVGIYYAPHGSGSYTLLTYAAASATTFSVTGLTPGTAYDFQVDAAAQRSAPGTATIVESARSNTSSATTNDGFTSAPFAPISYGQSFSLQLATSNPSGRTSWNVVLGLPPGLNFDSSTGLISGTPTQSGLYQVQLQANFTGGGMANQTLILRVVRPPTAPQLALPLDSTLTLTLGDVQGSIPVSGTFTDTAESAVRLVTTKGNIDVLLYNAETPQTVTNFLGYVNRGDYNNSVFHRISSIADSGVAVLQGGQFKPSALPALDTFDAITTQAAVPNEAGISNVNYTLAMAKQGGDPNSATSQFYFNLTDADTVLDPASQNGGFTVFGRVSNNSKATLDAITSSPVGGPYDITVAGNTVSQGFKWPMNVPDQASVPATMDKTKVMIITSVTPLQTSDLLTFSATSSNPSVATVSVSGTTLTVTQVAAGASLITLTATNLDGLSNSQSFTVTVNQNFSSWATAQGLTVGQSAATADPDNDGHSNLEEYAFLTDPKTPNSTAPTTYGVASAGNVSYGQITFPVRKFSPDLTYTVQVSDTLAANSWTNLWTSTDGFSAPVVTSAVDQSDRTVLTVRDTQASPPATRRFMRVLISSP